MAEKPKKTQKLRARLPRGLADRGPAEIAATRAMVEKIREVYERYGFEPVETPAFEYTDALGKFLPDQDRPNEGVFSLQDDDEQWISLRYDLTAPLARYVAENFDALPKPYRSYRFGWVFRNEKPGPGRFRQFMQFDADTVGAPTAAADAEMCMMAADTMEALGIPRGSYLVKVNNRKVLDGVLESIGLGGDENAGRRLTVLRAIDKLDKFPVDEIKKLLGPGRWDGGEEGKGDFTNGAGLSEPAIQRLLNVVSSAAQGVLPRDEMANRPADDMIVANDGRLIDNFGTLYHWSSQIGGVQSGFDGITELQSIAGICEASGYGSKRILIDPSVVRGLEYYTGPVYEVELLLETKDEKGRPVRFGSVGGGGRYDGLVSRFRGEPVPATGFSIGVSRLQAALEIVNRDKPKPKSYGPVVVTVFDRDRVADYQAMVAALRNAPVSAKRPNGPRIRAELYLGNPKNMGQQLKYADQRNAPCVIIQGSNEKSPGNGRKPRVIVKDLILGQGIAANISDRDEYLAKQSEAQSLVLEKYLVREIQKILARHGVSWD